MEPRKAIEVLVAAAAALANLNAPGQAEAQNSNHDQANPVLASSHGSSSNLPPISAMYGIMPLPAIERGDLAEMQRISKQMHGALNALGTKNAKLQARKAGVTEQHLREVKRALRILDQKIAEMLKAQE